MIYRVDLDSKLIRSEIYHSFRSDFSNVIEQIRSDISRMSITFQADVTSLTFDQLMSINLPSKILLLCTQATFYYLFNVIHERYNLGKQMVVADNDRPSIKIILTSDSYLIVVRKNFLVMDADSNEIIIRYHVCALIDPVLTRIVYRE